MKFEKIKMKIIPFSFALCPPRWSLKKRRKNVGLEHKGAFLGTSEVKKILPMDLDTNLHEKCDL